ncbi:MAG: DUF58 domain-containing protein [Chromatiaceae bacterium]|nr:DUF58 domain-containing protein [Chromatiaceae bacterium]
MPAGLQVALDELREIRAVAMQLGMLPADVVSALFPGAYRAVFHGRGIEFDEARDYQWGDDYRTIDWRVTARTGQMHTKLFREERERALYLLLDVGATMQFGSRVQLKWVLGARLAALFAWLSLASGNRVGAIVYGDSAEPRLLSPAPGEAGVSRLLNLLASLRPTAHAPRASLSDALLLLQKRVRPGALILLLSDFIGLDQTSKRHLPQLSRRCDLAAVRLYDPIERELPPPGLYPITDGENVSLLDTRSSTLRRRHRQLFAARGMELRNLCNHYQARLLSIATDQPLVESVREALIPLLSKTVRHPWRTG